MSTVTGQVATVSVDVGGQEIVFETGKLAKQADGAVAVRSGETMILATAVGRPDARPDADFFPLTVDVEERMYAAGKIPGGFFKREGRASERATLTARMIDRPIRPLWPKGFKNEVQVICTVLSADLVTPHDILCINGASAALMISPLPFLGPIGAVRIGRIEGALVVNPSLEQLEDSTLDLIVVGTRDALTMVEAGADQVPEDTILEAFELAHVEVRRICDALDDLRAQVGKPKWVDVDLTAELEAKHGASVQAAIAEHGLREAAAVVEEIVAAEAPEITMSSTEEDMVRRTQVKASVATIFENGRMKAVEGPIREQFEADLRELTDAEQDTKELRSAKRDLLFERILEEAELPFPVGPAPAEGEPQVKDSATRTYVKRACESIYKGLVRRKIAVEKRRPDGRSAEEIRSIWCEVGVSPRTHGSAIFTRGQTQIMTLLTLGTVKEGQKIDDLSREQQRRYLHHYNFPPYSVGETGFMRGPKRRDIGHGALAQRALEAAIPSVEEFPYTIRLVSETLESNGSSSMGSVCASTLALMDAGVPIAAMISGISVGLVTDEGGEFRILTDIQGMEDAYGDMDFKVTGSETGITAIQLDIKIHGLSREIVRAALQQAREARLVILDAMRKVIDRPRGELSHWAPRIETLKIHPDKIREVIGPGGKMIRAIQSGSDTTIEVEDDGTVRITGAKADGREKAKQMILGLTKEPEVGEVYEGKVTRIMSIGAFVEYLPGKEGLVRVSELSDQRVNRVEDAVKVGDAVRVKVAEVDRQGRVNLSMRSVGEEGTDAYEQRQRSERERYREREGGDGDRRGGFRRGPGGPPRR